MVMVCADISARIARNSSEINASPPPNFARIDRNRFSQQAGDNSPQPEFERITWRRKKA